MSGRSKLLSEVGSMSSKVACTHVWSGYQTRSAFLARAPIANFERWTNWKFSKFCPRTYSSPFFLLPITSACRRLLRRFANAFIDWLPIRKKSSYNLMIRFNIWIWSLLISWLEVFTEEDWGVGCGHRQLKATWAYHILPSLWVPVFYMLEQNRELFELINIPSQACFSCIPLIQLDQGV